MKPQEISKKFLKECEELFPKNNIKYMIEELSRWHHNRWVDRKLQEGWRFGHKLSFKEKTNPMLINWDNLSEAYKERDPYIFTKVVGLLRENGYMVVKKSKIQELKEKFIRKS